MRKQIILILFLVISIFIFNKNISASTNKNLVNIYFFHSNTCSHCKEESKYLEELENKYNNIRIYKYEISDKENIGIFKQIEKIHNIKLNSVPVTIIGNKLYTGFSNKSKITFTKTIEYFSKYGYVDELGEYLNIELPNYKINEDNITLDKFINKYHNYNLFGFKTDDLDISNISLLLGLLFSFNIISIIGLIIVLIINIKIKSKIAGLLSLLSYIILNTLLLLIGLINNHILTILIYVTLICLFIYILIKLKEYKIYNMIILISVIINFVITYLDNKTIIIFKNILELHNLTGLDKFSYYSNVVLLYFIINLIFIYIGDLLINKIVKKQT